MSQFGQGDIAVLECRSGAKSTLAMKRERVVGRVAGAGLGPSLKYTSRERCVSCGAVGLGVRGLGAGRLVGEREG